MKRTIIDRGGLLRCLDSVEGEPVERRPGLEREIVRLITLLDAREMRVSYGALTH